MEKTINFRLLSINFRMKQGFTLIELLIVIAILGILAAAVLIAINPGKRTRQAQDAKRKNDIGAMATEIQGYYVSPGMGTYPLSLDVLTADKYLKQMPYDPTGVGGKVKYMYATGTNATEASVYATLSEPTGAYPRLWCWRSVGGAASEVAAGSCAP